MGAVCCGLEHPLLSLSSCKFFCSVQVLIGIVFSDAEISLSSGQLSTCVGW